MGIIKKNSGIDRIEILANGVIQVRRRDDIIENEKIISHQYHRHCLKPGVDVTHEDLKVKKIAKIIWTKTVIDKFKEEEERIEALKKG